MRRFSASVLAVVLAAGVVHLSRAAPQVYLVGAAWRDISPGATDVNVGGFGLGDGSVIPPALIGPGSKRHSEGETIAARAIVVDDGTSAIAIATVETQGMFIAYDIPGVGLRAIAERVAAQVDRLPPDHVLVANNHTHSGPDAIGAWGFIPETYLSLIADQTVGAIVDAYNGRRSAVLTHGSDDAADLIYNQTCTEALNQSSTATYPNTVCTPTQERKDSLVRVLQARDATTGEVVTTLASFAAHATLGGGNGVHGDWPQFLSDALTARYGGVGIAMEGTNGRTQPCRPACSFTDPATPGYELTGRKARYTGMLMYHVEKALTGAPSVGGPVAAAKAFIRHEVENAGLLALTLQGDKVGVPIARSKSEPWVVGNTLLTITSAFRIGNILINGAPGEPYPNIPASVEEITNVPRTRHWTLALADDQLGYLIAPVEAYALIAAQSPVNDNAFFNVSPTIGDHVTCAQVRLAGLVGFGAVRPDPRCAAWQAWDTVVA